MNRIMQLSLAGLLLAGMGCAAEVERPRSDIVRNLSPGTSVVRSAQGEAMLHNKIGGLLFLLGDLEGSVREFRDAIRLSPEIPAPHNNLGMALHAQGEFTGARVEFLEAIRLNPRYAPARSNLGFVFFERGDLGSAVEHWQAAVRLDQHLASPRAGLALGLFTFGNVDQAVQSYSHALRLDRRYADVEYLRRVRRWSPSAVGQAAAILQLIMAREEVHPREVMT
ncbi:MAG: tetratricopeptide repeat protein [Nitrospirales bacterium]